MGSKSRVYIAYTGGTIGMLPSGSGYAPYPGYLRGVMENLRELQDPAMPEYVLSEYDPLLDSANMAPTEWRQIADDIWSKRHDYDGFVILHGTDTMAYTASALSFMLMGLGKTVILTGSQVPLCEVRGDARDNVITSMLIASHFKIPEVCLYFGGRLLRGNRSQKVHADAFLAFDSPNYPYLGMVGVDIAIQWQHIRARDEGRRRLEMHSEAHVGQMRVFPGISSQIIENFLRPPLQGLVLETYGVGNGPVRDKKFMAAIQEAIARGVVVVSVTQCLRGKVDLEDYETGRQLSDIGVIGGQDMTPEAALTKLYMLFGSGLSPEAVREDMARDLCGELTAPQFNVPLLGDG